MPTKQQLNHSRWNKNRALIVLLLATIAGIPAGNAEMYKVVDAEGNVSFTDTPPSSKAQQDVETVKQLETNSMPSKTYKGELQEQFEKRTTERQAQRKEAWDAYDQKIKDAVAALKRAREALEKGKEIQDGDRMGIVSQGKQTGSRLSEQYLERIETLEQEVAKAKKNLRAVKKQRPTLMRP